MKKKGTSLQGKFIRELIGDITATSYIGESIQTGKLRAKPVEPIFIYKPSVYCEKVALENFTLEYLKKRKEKEYNSEYSILQLHGGGYIGPMKNAYRRFSIAYQERCGQSDVVTIDYRIAPEFPFPAPFEDAVAAYQWMVNEKGYDPEKIIIAGDSAGGGLALALSMYLRDNQLPSPAGLILMSPWADLTNSGDSYTENFEIDPLFGNSTNNLLFHSSYIGDNDPREPYISPLFGSFENLPPMLIQVGTHEVLLSDSKITAAKAKRAGCKVRLSIYEGMFHVFQMSGELLPESRRAWEEIGQFYKVIGGNTVQAETGNKSGWGTQKSPYLPSFRSRIPDKKH